ncbi:hypothetical protein CR203_24025 [Salipaludibacillus neizhouensis]|uniref:SIR2-like domain-containing protein n=1 Tax=Salipaludibacillus neizhouensis TaxID=885475 RepID=A0A3A9JX71_9BACI|nr:hypothetical protein [Salipaludibacillus neizhouensis]RKL64859.1 hypothetical protein CR203_24025 [Salipaludibacillus neizhouensis]
MLTEYQWIKDSIGKEDGGNLLLEWLDNARNHDESVLFICGAGLSMTGATPAPSGWHVGEAYENYLRTKGIDIPSEKSGDISKLYEYFCYPEVKGIKVFSNEKHNEFIDAITSRNHLFRFSGRPNFQHHSLLNEVLEAKGNIRIYSLNLDEFFDVASIFSENGPHNLVVNGANLKEEPISNRIFRDWKILAAHGKNIKNEQSVWSENILVNSMDDEVPKHLLAEKQIITKAIECIKQGPYFEKVIFVGVAAPLTYLINDLKEKLTENFQWAWFNPFKPPQEWLINSDLEKTFNETNGVWVETGLTECLWNAHSTFYQRWLSTSCNENITDIPLLQKYSNESHKKTLVESIYRARRIYDKGLQSFVENKKNPEFLSEISDSRDVYSYPQMLTGNRYEDSNLGESLHKLFLSRIELSRSPSENFPELTVANKISDSAPISAHIFKFNSLVPENEVAIGIARTFDGVFINSNHRHIIIIDVQLYNIENLIRAVETEVTRRFPSDYKYIDVTTADQLDMYLDSHDFSLPPERARRP